MERFSISISSQIKKQLELMAKANYRTLSGEINKALDDYVKQSGMNVDIGEPRLNNFEPHTIHTEPIKHQSTSRMHQTAPISTTLFSNDEIEEF